VAGFHQSVGANFFKLLKGLAPGDVENYHLYVFERAERASLRRNTGKHGRAAQFTQRVPDYPHRR